MCSCAQYKTLRDTNLLSKLQIVNFQTVQMSNYSSLYLVQVANNEFAASSPDEKAILECCADHGFVFQVGNFTQLPNCKRVFFSFFLPQIYHYNTKALLLILLINLIPSFCCAFKYF